MAVFGMMKTYLRVGALAMCCGLLLGCSGDPEVILPDGSTISETVADIEDRASGLSYAQVLATPERHPIALARYIAEHSEESSLLFHVYSQMIQSLSKYPVPQEAVLDVLFQAQWHLENSTHPDFFDPYRFELTIIEGYIDIGLVEEGMMRLRELDERLSQQLSNPSVMNARYKRGELVLKAKDVAFLETIVERQTDPVIRAEWRAYLGLLYLESGEELRARRVADDISFRLGELRWLELPLDNTSDNYQLQTAYAALFDLFAALGDQRNALEVLEMSYTRMLAESTDNPYWQLAGRLEFIEKFASIDERERARQLAIEVVFTLQDYFASEQEFALYFIYSGVEELIDVLIEFDMQEEQQQLVQMMSGMIMSDDDPEMLWYALITMEFMKNIVQESTINDMLHHIRYLTNELSSVEERLVVYSWKLDLYPELGLNRDAQRMLSLLEAELDRARPEEVGELFEFIGEKLLIHDRKDLYDRYIVSAVESTPYLVHTVGYALAEHDYYEDALALILGHDDIDMMPYFLLSIGEVYISKQRIPKQKEQEVLEAIYQEVQTLMVVYDSADAY